MVTKPLKVLITRPQQQALRLAACCQKVGIDNQITPLFDYQANNSLSSSSFACCVDAVVIFISVAAVEFAQKCKPIHLWQAQSVIAVGSATEQALKNLGVDALVPKVHNSEGVLALAELQKVNNKNVVIIRGNGGRELLAKQLTQDGAMVRYIEVYQRCWHTLTDNTVLLWQQKNINCVLLTSLASLAHIEKSVNLCDNYWKNNCLWIAASARIANKAGEYGLKHVVNAKGANDDALMAVIKQYG